MQKGTQERHRDEEDYLPKREQYLLYSGEGKDYLTQGKDEKGFDWNEESGDAIQQQPLFEDEAYGQRFLSLYF